MNFGVHQGNLGPVWYRIEEKALTLSYYPGFLFCHHTGENTTFRSPGCPYPAHSPSSASSSKNFMIVLLKFLILAPIQLASSGGDLGISAIPNHWGTTDSLQSTNSCAKGAVSHFFVHPKAAEKAVFDQAKKMICLLCCKVLFTPVFVLYGKLHSSSFWWGLWVISIKKCTALIELAA